jgi:hypothetical protein
LEAANFPRCRLRPKPIAARRRRALGAGLCALALFTPVGGAPTRAAEPLAVSVSGASEPVRCAEKDNVTLNLASKEVRRFRIEAAHPAYLGELRDDSFGADWTGCAATDAPTAVGAAKRTTLYEEVDLWVVGLTFASFWRPATTPLRIGDRVVSGLHLIQVWMIRPMGGEEVVVLYPPDGYWRMRPLAPRGRAPTAFGSSFLIGPVEVSGRPLVKIRDIAFDPKSRAFTLAFERGGSAVVRLASVDEHKSVLEVELEPAIGDFPFAALRSMYVSDVDNDVARVGVREGNSATWREQTIMDFGRATASSVWAGRASPSRHNTSSPDMVFDAFSGGN